MFRNQSKTDKMSMSKDNSSKWYDWFKKFSHVIWKKNFKFIFKERILITTFLLK